MHGSGTHRGFSLVSPGWPVMSMLMGDYDDVEERIALRVQK